jgi:hypothetical protein
MINVPSGGDGMPNPPDTAVVAGSSSTGVLDSSIFKEILPGNKVALNLGANDRLAAGPIIGNHFFLSSYTGLPPVQEGTEDQENEEMQEPEATAVMDVEETQGAIDDVSLASVSGNTISSLAKATKEAVQPGHQSMDDSVKSETQKDGNETATDDDKEVVTIITCDAKEMKQYQMKLLTSTKNAMKQLMKVIDTMLQKHTCMVITVHDLVAATAYDSPISYPDALPETEVERAPFFLKINDKINKDGTSIIFWACTDFDHITWQTMLPMDKIIQDMKLHIGVHKLESTETQIIGFMSNKNDAFAQVIKSKFPNGTPTFIVEHIYPRVKGGFEASVKTDVLGI